MTSYTSMIEIDSMKEAIQKYENVVDTKDYEIMQELLLKLNKKIEQQQLAHASCKDDLQDMYDAYRQRVINKEHLPKITDESVRIFREKFCTPVKAADTNSVP
jgi:flagellar biosynthesis chaperone FliJ